MNFLILIFEGEKMENFIELQYFDADFTIDAMWIRKLPTFSCDEKFKNSSINEVLKITHHLKVFNDAPVTLLEIRTDCFKNAIVMFERYIKKLKKGNEKNHLPDGFAVIDLSDAKNLTVAQKEENAKKCKDSRFIFIRC